MKKVIILQKSATIKASAREFLSNNWGSVFLIILCYNLFIQGIPALINSLTTPSFLVKLPYLDYLTISTFFESIRLDTVDTFSVVLYPDFSISLWVVLYLVLLIGAFTFCLKMFLINYVRTREVEFKSALAGFRYFFKAALLSIIINLKVLLWSILLIVPGVFALVNYSQAQYILADDPSKGIMQCIKESCYLMKGNRRKIVCFYFSYFGWFALTAILILLVLGLAVFFIGTSTSIFFVFIIELIPISFYYTYFATGLTVFYETLIGNVIPVDRLYEASKEIKENKKEVKKLSDESNNN